MLRDVRRGCGGNGSTGFAVVVTNVSLRLRLGGWGR